MWEVVVMEVPVPFLPPATCNANGTIQQHLWDVEPWPAVSCMQTENPTGCCSVAPETTTFTWGDSADCPATATYNDCFGSSEPNMCNPALPNTPATCVAWQENA